MDLSASFLNAASRRRALFALAATTPSEPLDVLVVGGGVTGTGAALDATLRGLQVGLVEQSDYASGASGASSRLAHGGLRYLEHGHVRLVSEALRERRLLLTEIAPHLASRVDFLLPCRTTAETAYARTGIAVYDAIAKVARGRLEGPRSRVVSGRELSVIAPSLAQDAFHAAVQFSDGQIDDARHTVALARTAQAYGALMANHARVVDVEPTPEGAVRCRVAADEHSFDVHARSVLLACGPWSNTWARSPNAPLVRPSKGVHLVIPRDRLDLSHAVISRTSTSVLFILPWGSTWIVGTTDTEYAGSPDDLATDEADVDYLLREANRVVRPGLRASDVIATYAGLRPLATASGSTARASREHVVRAIDPGVFSITGGKYTTYRVMARDSVDALCRHLGRAGLRSTTDEVPLVGAPAADFTFGPERPADGLDPVLVRHLTDRYGAEGALLARATWGPNAARQIDGPGGHRWIDVEHALRHEGARTVDDVLARRLRLSTEDAGAASAAAVTVRQIARHLSLSATDEVPSLSA